VKCTCGQINDSKSRFCSGCGQRLNISEASKIYAEDTSPLKTVVSHGGSSGRIPAPDNKLDSHGNILMIHPDGTVVNNKYALYYLTAGGMGAVYMASNTGNDEMFIIKEAVFADRENQLKLVISLTQEREALIRLKHPAIVKAFDFFIDGNACYLVLEYVDGQVMEHIIQQTMPKFTPEETVVDWAIQIADALDYLHNQDPPIIYRDLKPDNLMVDKENNIKVIDFGATRVYKEGHERDTRAIGTAGFAAPEQYGSAQTDARSDIYSLGATMHYLLTNRYPGEMPFVFPLARSINPAVSDKIDMIVQKAVQPDMKNRFSTALEMKEELMKTLGEKCPNCSSMNRTGYRFCKKCGKKPESKKPAPPPLKKTLPVESKPAEISVKKVLKSDELTETPKKTPVISHKRPSADIQKEKNPDEISSIDEKLKIIYGEAPLHEKIPDDYITKEDTKEEIQPPYVEVQTDTKPFVFKNGKEAYDIYQLVELCRRYPEEGKYHLRRHEFTPWIMNFDIPDYGLEEIITAEWPDWDLAYFCSLVSEFLEDMKSKKELPYLTDDEVKKLAQKHRLASLIGDLKKTITSPSDQSEMILIPQGEFWMGKEGGENNPRHLVYLDAYYIDKLPVTNLQYERFIRETKYKSEGDWKKYYTTGMAYYPVTCITWKDASTYLEWVKKRLPTEAEWEKAAAGKEGKLFPWGNKWDPNKCNNLLLNRQDLLRTMCNMEDGRGTIQAGSIPEGKSPYGVEDMSGNVSEWCIDWYDKDYYKKSPESNPTGPPSGKFKVNRGGSWRGGSWKSDHTYFFECSFRAYNKPNDRIGFYGFRGVKEI